MSALEWQCILACRDGKAYGYVLPNGVTVVWKNDQIWLRGIRAALKSCGGGIVTWHRRHCTVRVHRPDKVRKLFRAVGVKGF